MHTHDAQKNSGALKGFSSMLTEHPVLMGVLWVGMFIVLTGVSFALGIVPKLDADTKTPDVALAQEQNETKNTVDDTPRRLIIERIGIDTPIENPQGTDLATLNDALLSGAVHYPGSGNLDDVSNMFLFGHSTGFRVVNNDAYKAFNGLKDLKENDLIRVQSESHEYVYRVTKVSLVDAETELVQFSSSEKKLTLSTCNVFGQKQERYVVEAVFVGSYGLSEQGA
jgi:LPXTG-site transpeptidase (sortase) family protein